MVKNRVKCRTEKNCKLTIVKISALHFRQKMSANVSTLRNKPSHISKCSTQVYIELYERTTTNAEDLIIDPWTLKRPDPEA